MCGGENQVKYPQSYIMERPLPIVFECYWDVKLSSAKNFLTKRLVMVGRVEEEKMCLRWK